MAEELPPVENHYAYLGLSIFATPEEIQAAVDQRVQQARELEASDPGAAQDIRVHLQQIQEDLLSGTKAKAIYDERLFAQETPDQPAAEPLPEPPVPAPPPIAPPSTPAPPPGVTQPAPRPTAPPAGPPRRRGSRRLFSEGGPLWATAFILVGAILALAAVFLLNRLVDLSPSSSTTPTPHARSTPAPRTAPPTASPTAPPTTSVPPTLPGTTPVPPTSPLAQDRAIIKAHGFTPDEGLPISTPAGPGQSLYAWRATCAGSVDGHCQEVFFFAGARYLSTDTANPSRLILNVMAAGPGRFAITYANYLPQDHDCCPTGPPIRMIYALKGSKMVRAKS